VGHPGSRAGAVAGAARFRHFSLQVCCRGVNGGHSAPGEGPARRGWCR
jgi:hypothetical protein